VAMHNSDQTILKKFKKQRIFKIILLAASYCSIFSIIVVYSLIAVKKSSNIKIIKSFQDNQNKLASEKIMTNPSIKIKYNGNDIYHINAKRAYHSNDEEAILEKVTAKGKIGKITANKLEIKDNGNRLIFSDNPKLILTKKSKNN
jgi:hypothetical protein